MKEIIFENLSKAYDKKNYVLDSLNLRIESGERVILLGPSGCGKSTTLRIIAGLESVSEGKLTMNGALANDIPAEKRNISMVFQNYALYPHMTVRENIEYALKLDKLNKKEIRKRSNQAIEVLRLDGLEDRKPRDLSGGQRQRVALSRAIVKHTDYLLLDEPLSNLDAQLRFHSRQELVKIHEKFGMTMVYVTHDQVEAMTVAEKIVILDKGKVQMVGSPYEIYHKPKNIFTAKFIGSPPMNIMQVKYSNGALIFRNSYKYMLNNRLKRIIEENNSDDLYLGIRPEKIRFVRSGEEGMPVKIMYLENYGSGVSIYFNIGGETFNIVQKETKLKLGDTIRINFCKEEIILFDRASGENIMKDKYSDSFTSQIESIPLSRVGQF